MTKLQQVSPREHPNFRSRDFQGKLYGWWRHFQWKSPTRADIAQLPVAYAHISHKGTLFEVTWPSVTTFDNVTTCQKAPLGRILRNFQLRMRTYKGTTSGSRDLRSLPLAMVLVLLYYIVYYYKMYRLRMRTRSLQWLPVPDRVASGHMTSGDVTSGQGHFR